MAEQEEANQQIRHLSLLRLSTRCPLPIRLLHHLLRDTQIHLLHLLRLLRIRRIPSMQIRGTLTSPPRPELSPVRSPQRIQQPAVGIQERCPDGDGSESDAGCSSRS